MYTNLEILLIRVRHLERANSNCSVSGLPAGVKYQIKTAAATCTLKFSGNVTKQGKYTSKLVYEDELGNKFSMTIIWLVYDGTELLVKDAEKVLTTAWGTTLPQLKVYGGNGTDTSDYTYEILREESDSAALAVSSLINGGAGIQVSSQNCQSEPTSFVSVRQIRQTLL